MTTADRQEALAKVIEMSMRNQWVAYLILMELGWEPELIDVMLL